MRQDATITRKTSEQLPIVRNSAKIVYYIIVAVGSYVTIKTKDRSISSKSMKGSDQWHRPCHVFVRDVVHQPGQTCTTARPADLRLKLCSVIQAIDSPAQTKKMLTKRSIQYRRRQQSLPPVTFSKATSRVLLPTHSDDRIPCPGGKNLSKMLALPILLLPRQFHQGRRGKAHPAIR